MGHKQGWRRAAQIAVAAAWVGTGLVGCAPSERDMAVLREASGWSGPRAANDPMTGKDTYSLTSATVEGMTLRKGWMYVACSTGDRKATAIYFSLPRFGPGRPDGSGLWWSRMRVQWDKDPRTLERPRMINAGFLIVPGGGVDSMVGKMLRHHTLRIDGGAGTKTTEISLAGFGEALGKLRAKCRGAS